MASKPRNFWTRERVLGAARVCKSRREWCRKYQGARAAARRLGITRQCESLLPKRRGSRYLRATYAFEFSDRSVYVGLTYNYDIRLAGHMKQGSSAGLKAQTCAFVFRRFNDWARPDQAAKNEARRIDRYRSLGWTVLNRQPAGGIGSSVRRWTRSALIMEMKRHTYLMDFINASPAAYYKSKRLGLLRKHGAHLKRRGTVRGFWTRRRVIAASKKFSSVAEFRVGHPRAYDAAKRLRLTSALTHLQRARTRRPLLTALRQCA